MCDPAYDNSANVIFWWLSDLHILHNVKNIFLKFHLDVFHIDRLRPGQRFDKLRAKKNFFLEILM